MTINYLIDDENYAGPHYAPPYEIKPKEFWKENVSNSLGKHNLPESFWLKICKIRSRPIRLIKDHILEETSKTHVIISEGSLGYIIDHPECFNFTSVHLQKILNASPHVKPAITQHGDLLFLRDDEFEVVEPFFDINIANLADKEVTENASA
jgi:hypothetical protein